MRGLGGVSRIRESDRQEFSIGALESCPTVDRLCRTVRPTHLDVYGSYPQHLARRPSPLQQGLSCSPVP